MTGGLLAIFAHPDDETFGIGGTMAHYAARGVPVTMVSATRGEVGEIAPGTDATPETLGEHRERELREAMAILGVSDVRFLGFRDSGMYGTDENRDPRAYINADVDAVVGAMVRIIRERRPDVLVTWDASGGYGHPDHIAVHEQATAAYHAAADPARYPGDGAPWQTPRLYYNAIPVDMFVELMDEMTERGGETPSIAEDERMNSLPRVVPNCVIDVNAHFTEKERAMLAHRTQIGDIEPFMKLPESSRRRFFAHEYYYRADPPLADGEVIDDLFA